MKTILLGAVLAFMAGILGSLVVVHAADHSPRMVQIGSEEVDHKGGEGGMLFTRYVHDNDTGQEIVCISGFVHGDGVMSCYPTGRTWK
jgi:hypothetical protein